MSLDDTNDSFMTAEELMARAGNAGSLLTAQDIVDINNGFPPDTSAITPGDYNLIGLYGEDGFTHKEVVLSVQRFVANLGVDVTGCGNHFNAAAPVGYTPLVPQQKYNLNLPKPELNMNKSAGD